jgi:hypothetical protein
LQGDLDEALEQGRYAVELGGRAAHSWWSPTARALLASSLLEAGEVHEARTTAGEAVTAAGPDAVAACRLRCLAPLAEAQALSTGVDEVPASLHEADRLLADITAPPGSAWLLGADVYLCVARAWRAVGRHDRAHAVLIPLVASAERHGWRTLVAAAASVDGCRSATTRATAAQ